MLEEGRCASISEVAAAEKLDRGYLGRVLRLTLLAPDIVEAILNGRQPPDLGLPRLRIAEAARATPGGVGAATPEAPSGAVVKGAAPSSSG
jgi:hypothetical protein